jgi:hypothetical protein
MALEGRRSFPANHVQAQHRLLGGGHLFVVLVIEIKTSTPAAMPPPKVAETKETFAEISVSVRLARPLASTVPVLPSRWT